MADVLDAPEEGGSRIIHEAESVLQDASAPTTKFTHEELLAYWGYLRRWRASCNTGNPCESNRRGSTDAPFTHEPPALIMKADKDRRNTLVLRRAKRASPEFIAAMAGVNRFLLLEPADDRLPSWAKDMEDD
jgi:hypothetical protein